MRNLTSVVIAIAVAMAIVGAQSFPTPSTDTWRPRRPPPDPNTPASPRASARRRRRPRRAMPTPAAPRPPGAPARETLVREAGEGLRQSLLRRPDGILGVGRDDVRRHHHHRSDLRLLGRRRSRQRLEVARPRSQHHQVRADQPRAFRSRRRRVVSAGSLQREGDHVGGGLDAARRHARLVAQAEEASWSPPTARS